MKTYRLLIWCPLVNPGGGVRLLIRLISALAIRPEIKGITLVVPRGSISPERISEAARPAIRWCEFDPVSPPIRLVDRIARRFGSRPPLPPDQQELVSQMDDCDVVYAFWPHRLDFPDVPKPIVCTFQDAIYFDFPEVLGGKETILEWHRAAHWLKSASQVVVSSMATKDALKRHFDIPPEKLALVHHAILPTDPTTEVQLPPSCADALPPRYLVFPAPISSHKNHYNLFIAWARFADRMNYPLVLMGNCTQLLNFKHGQWPKQGDSPRLTGVLQRHELCMGKDYYALGYVPDEDIPRIIRRAAALIMPTLAEGGGSYPVEEALRLGVPVLCSDIPVLREHLKGRSATIGWFDPESPDSILAALNEWRENYDARKQSAVEGMKDPRPTWDDVADGYAAIFSRVAAEGKHGTTP